MSKSWILLLILTPLFYGCSPTEKMPLSVEDVHNNDYPELLKRCNGNKCCESSEHSVEAARGFLKKLDQSCPEGFKAI
jgi:hypothetical protein